MKKKLLLSLAALVAISLGVVGIGAFESHIINVTAHIENVLTVPVEESGISFGAVFPEEVAYKNFSMSLSESFLAEPRVDDVNYVLRQKPKCGVPVPGTDPLQYSSFVQVTDGPNGTFVCPMVEVEIPGNGTEQVQSVMLPLLCPFLSKYELNEAGATTTNGIAAFHGPLTNWTMTDTLATQLTGHLSKAEGKTEASYLIDLHAPCFQGMCAQDNIIPPAYRADPTNEHQLFGCDLWVEITGLSTPRTTLTVNKVLSPPDDPGKFNLQIDSTTYATNAVNGSTTGAIGVTPGVHTVGEIAGTGTDLANYTTVIGGDPDCVDGSVTVNLNENKVCTITNTKKATTGTLTVIKHVDNTGGGTHNASEFTMNVTGTSPSPASFAGVESLGTDVTLGVGSYSVDETGPSGYTKSLGTDCSGTIAAGDHKTCTVTNSFQPAKITIQKIVINHIDGATTTPANFQMKIDGGDVNQDVKNTVAPGTYTISESGPSGYTTTFSGACNGIDQVTVVANDDVICTVKNEQQFFTVTVNKVVNNTCGGNNVLGDFHLFVGPYTATSSVSKKVAVGTYLISESGVGGYNAIFSGDCNPSTQLLTGANGDNKICTITNTDICPVITLVKNVVGGTKHAEDFIMRVDGVPVPSAGSKSVTSNGTGHAITEDTLTGYTFTSMTGTGSRGSTCPATLGGSVILNEGEVITCTITNTATP